MASIIFIQAILPSFFDRKWCKSHIFDLWGERFCIIIGVTWVLCPRIRPLIFLNKSHFLYRPIFSLDYITVLFFVTNLKASVNQVDSGRFNFFLRDLVKIIVNRESSFAVIFGHDFEKHLKFEMKVNKWISENYK